MTFQIRSDELKEVQDTGLIIMREARARTANLKQGKLALDGAGTVVKARKEDLVERLNAGKLTEIESKLIETPPKPMVENKKRGRKRAA